MRAATGASGELDLSGSQALVAALEDQRAAALARLAAANDTTADAPNGLAATRETAPQGQTEAAPAADPREEPTALVETALREAPADSAPSVSQAFEVLPASEAVQPGHVLALDETRPGLVRPAARELDRGVLGCAVTAGESLDLPAGHAALGVSGIVLCRADASFGAIGVGDLLTTSPNPGHAMVAGEYARGAVLGKAVEGLGEGIGLIRVLVNPR
jgi:hypothetical protein